MSSSNKFHFILLVLQSRLCSPIGITPLKHMTNSKIIPCTASFFLPPEEVSFSDQVFGDELGMITYSTFPPHVSLRAHTWGLRVISSIVLKERSCEKKRRDFVIPHPKRKCSIYLNEEGDDVNKVPLFQTSSHVHTSYFPSFPPNPGCKCFSIALSTGLDFSNLWLGHCNPFMLPEHRRGVGFSYLFCLLCSCPVKTENWHLSFNF